jgi:hypothetical protein
MQNVIPFPKVTFPDLRVSLGFIVQQFKRATALAMILMLVACSSLAPTLDAITIAVDTAVPILQTAGLIPPGTGIIITTLSTNALKAVALTSAENATTDSKTLKISKDVGFWADVLICDGSPGCTNILPAGTPQVALSVVIAISSAISTYLSEAGIVIPPAPGAAPRLTKPVKVKNLSLTAKEDAMIRAHVQVVQERLAAASLHRH